MASQPEAGVACASRVQPMTATAAIAAAPRRAAAVFPARQAPLTAVPATSSAGMAMTQ